MSKSKSKRERERDIHKQARESLEIKPAKSNDCQLRIFCWYNFIFSIALLPKKTKWILMGLSTTLGKVIPALSPQPRTKAVSGPVSGTNS